VGNVHDKAIRNLYLL